MSIFIKGEGQPIITSPKEEKSFINSIFETSVFMGHKNYKNHELDNTSLQKIKSVESHVPIKEKITNGVHLKPTTPQPFHSMIDSSRKNCGTAKEWNNHDCGRSKINP